MNAIHQDVRAYLHSDIHMRGLAFALQSTALYKQAAILKHGCIVFSKKSFADHLSNCGPAAQVHVMNSHFFPLSLLEELSIDILALEVCFCSLETSSWRLSLISSCGV